MTAVLHTEIVTFAWAANLRAMLLPGPVMGVTGMPYDMARNAAAMRCLDGGFSHIFFLDSDVLPPPDAVPRLLARGLPVVSGLYFRRSPPAGVPVMQRPAGTWVTQYPPDALVEVDVVGAGCLLIAREVLERLPPQRPGKHWFDWRVDQAGVPGNALPPMSEDFTFNLWLKATLGVPTVVDTGVVCKHIGLGAASYGRFDPAAA